MTSTGTDEAPAPDRWLTVAEVAAAQQVHPKTVLRWIATRQLPAVRLGRHWRVSARQLDLMLARGNPDPA